MRAVDCIGCWVSQPMDKDPRIWRNLSIWQTWVAPSCCVASASGPGGDYKVKTGKAAARLISPFRKKSDTERKRGRSINNAGLLMLCGANGSENGIGFLCSWGRRWCLTCREIRGGLSTMWGSDLFTTCFLAHHGDLCCSGIYRNYKLNVHVRHFIYILAEIVVSGLIPLCSFAKW
jgi:hypothetical protein